MDALSRLSDAARAMSREVTRRRVTAAFAVPEAEARAAAGRKLAAAVAKHREVVGDDVWARFEGALASAVATGECEALSEAIDALEAARMQHRVAGAADDTAELPH